MKVLFFVGEFNGGGAERVISIIANKMVERNFDVEILKYHNTENSYYTNPLIKINSVEENTNTRNNTLKNLKWMKNYFKNNCDVVISFLAPFNILAILANLGNKTPIIVADRNDPNRVPSNTVVRKLRNLLYKRADLVVLQTNDNKSYFDYLGDKASVIPNPIDMAPYVGKAIGTEKANKIVSVGRLEKQKNQIMLIDAFKDVKDEFPNHSLVIYGEGSYRKELESRIDELGLENKVSLPGESSKVLDSINDAELFVLSSDYEGMANALAEAMCLGLPVISTKVSGAKELIEDGMNGYLIDINDRKALADKMRILLNDVKLRNDFALEATKISDYLDVNVVVDKWCDCINKVKM